MQAVHDNHGEKIDNPSNGVSIVGYLRPAFIEEESYLRSLFGAECSADGYSSNWRGASQLAHSCFYHSCASIQLFVLMRVNLTEEYNREPQPASGTNGLIGNLISVNLSFSYLP